jgi:spermidine synthase
MNIFEGLQPPKVLYEAESEYNGLIQVVQVGSTRKIKVDKIDQSISHNSPSCGRLVWGKSINVLKENVPQLRSILILGMGGGTMAHLISQSFPGVRIVSVEIDPVMIQISRDYFDLDQIPNHQVIQADAMRVVIEPEKFGIQEGEFDAVIVDVFTGEKYPDLGKSGNFVAAVNRLAVPGGLVVYNRIYRQEHQDAVNVFIDYLSNFLTNVKLLVVAGYTNSDNVLIFGRTGG